MSDVILELRDNIGYVTLNRPDAANAINLQMATELAEAAYACNENPSVRAVLLTGAGKMFCGGGDLKSFAAEPPAQLPTLLKKITLYLHKAISEFSRMKAPLIIAVNGSAGGGGMSLACSGDFVIAGESARFTMAYTRVGLTPDGSSTYFLPRIIGVRKTLELAINNPVLSAADALGLGIISRVVPDTDLIKEADNFARQLAAGPTHAFGGVKRLLHASMTNSLEDQMALETGIIVEMGRTADAQEGINSFLAKRAPKFSGS